MCTGGGAVIGDRAWAVCLEEALGNDICVGGRKRQKQRILIALPEPPPILSEPCTLAAMSCTVFCRPSDFGMKARGEDRSIWGSLVAASSEKHLTFT